MKNLILLISLLSISTISYSQVQIAPCENPEGYVYYPNIYPVPRDKSGWIKDKITGGKSILIKNKNDKFDILFIDSVSKTPKILS